MANIAQSDLDTIQTTIAASSNVSAAQKSQSEGLLYALAVTLFGGNATSSIASSTSGCQ